MLDGGAIASWQGWNDRADVLVQFAREGVLVGDLCVGSLRPADAQDVGALACLDAPGLVQQACRQKVSGGTGLVEAQLGGVDNLVRY
jgi:hypothetical protein